MQVKKFNLTFIDNKFTDYVQDTFKSIFENEALTDIILVCDDNLFLKAHKFVLSSWSPVFKRIISTLPRSEATVFLRGVKGYEMEKRSPLDTKLFCNIIFLEPWALGFL